MIAVKTPKEESRKTFDVRPSQAPVDYDALINLANERFPTVHEILAKWTSWLPTDIVVKINFANVAQTGENHALLLPEKLQGAMARPQNLWHYADDGVDAVTLAVSYMESIAMAHAFEQGNKRTGFDAGFIFLRTNGYDLIPAADNELLAVLFLELIERVCTATAFETYLSDFIEPL